MNYDEAAAEAQRLMSEGAGRERLLPAVERAAKLAPKGQDSIWPGILKALRSGREVRAKEMTP